LKPEARTLVRMTLRDASDLAMARKHLRELGAREGMARAAVESLATAMTEIVRNVLVHAGEGELFLGIDEHDRRAIWVVTRDEGPGISDPKRALEDGFSTAGSLGLGLSGARRMVDEFEMVSTVGQGTTITMKKWISKQEAGP
jgi:serine/threonine-protein kinase RsbT